MASETSRFKYVDDLLVAGLLVLPLCACWFYLVGLALEFRSIRGLEESCFHRRNSALVRGTNQASSETATVKYGHETRGRPSLLRHTNALAILRLLRETTYCSRADLVRASGLSAPTVTNVVNDLLSVDIVRTLGEGESNGGRPPDLIRFNAELGCLLAIEISSNHLSFLLADLSGVELTRARVSIKESTTTPKAICKLIGKHSRSLLRKQKRSNSQLLALVVGVPAITDVENGVVVSISTLDQWRDVPLRELLENVVECQVIVENDTNLAALGEYSKGAARQIESFIAINIGTNVSAGIVLDGKIHHGAQWSAGEIAYLRLPGVSRKHPSLHEFGELERVLTNAGISHSWRESLARPNRQCGSDDLLQAGDVADAVLDMANKGDARALKIILPRAIMISDLVINISLVLNPALTVLGGTVGSHPFLLTLVERELEKCEFAAPRIACATLGDMAGLWGAIAIALDRLPSILLPQV